MIFRLTGTPEQQQLVQQAIERTDFPWELLVPSLARESRTQVSVDWADLSRFAVAGADNSVSHDHAGGAHSIEREVDGRVRVLGLFYLPPHTRIVLDNGLASRPELAAEVFVAEAAHLVDYHWMRPGHREVIWNALHPNPEDDVPEGTVIPESGDVDHGHSWFDGPAGYGTWVGEDVMEAFTRAFAPSVQVTIRLAHPTTPQAAGLIRAALLDGTVFATERGRVYHDTHGRIRPGRRWPDAAAARADGLKPCRVCRPGK